MLGRSQPAAEIAVVPFAVAVDDREGAPYRFAGLRGRGREAGKLLVVRTECRRLRTGDYAILGRESVAAVERKSLDDLYRTVGGGRQRFIAELERLAAMPHAAVVVESDFYSAIYTPPPGCRLNPSSLWGSVIGWQIQFPTVHWWWASTRKLAEETCFRFLEMTYRRTEGGNAKE